MIIALITLSIFCTLLLLLLFASLFQISDLKKSIKEKDEEIINHQFDNTIDDLLNVRNKN